MDMTIRSAVSFDAEIPTSLTVAGKRHWDYPEAWLETWRGLLTITPEYLTANVVNCAEDETGKVVGFYSLERDRAGLRLENLFLEASLIGCGLGRQLFEHAVAVARALRATELLIESDPNAEGFYLRMRTRRTGESVSSLTGTECVAPQLRYAL